MPGNRHGPPRPAAAPGIPSPWPAITGASSQRTTQRQRNAAGQQRRFSRSGRGVLATRAQAQDGTVHQLTCEQRQRLMEEAGLAAWPPDESAGADAIEDAAEEIVRDRRRGQGPYLLTVLRERHRPMLRLTDCRQPLGIVGKCDTHIRVKAWWAVPNKIPPINIRSQQPLRCVRVCSGPYLRHSHQSGATHPPVTSCTSMPRIARRPG